MKNIFLKKIVFGLLFGFFFATLSLAQHSKQIYTVEKAQDCFHSKALSACEDKINKCLMQKQCEKELHFYHDCNFESETKNQVFNGNCFRDWKSTASASKQVINCIDSHCNLAAYNSEVSIKVLYTCTSEALVQYKLECNNECQNILQQKIRKRIQFEPINEVYGKLTKQDIGNNQNVQKLVEIIKKQCIDENGSIKQRHERDLLKKKTNKQRMIDKINQKNKDEAYLKQYDVENDTKQTEEEF